MSRISSPVTWVGGKGRLLKHILPLIQPRPGEMLYVEPFGGSGVVLINKEPHSSETYNDTDGDLVNLFRVIRDPDGVVHLWWELVNTQISREEFTDAIKAADPNYSPIDRVKRAAQFVIRCRQRFGGGMTGAVRTDTPRSWGTTRKTSRDMNECVSKWLNTMLGLPAIHRRLSTVVVDNQDAERCIRQWDMPCTLFYVDPPYVGHEAYYQGGFDEAAHRKLAVALNELQGRAVVSYYPCPLVDELYPKARWHRIFIKTFASACGNAPRDPSGKPQKVREAQKRTELILCNFDPRTRKRLHSSVVAQ